MPSRHRREYKQSQDEDSLSTKQSWVKHTQWSKANIGKRCCLWGKSNTVQAITKLYDDNHCLCCYQGLMKGGYIAGRSHLIVSHRVCTRLSHPPTYCPSHPKNLQPHREAFLQVFQIFKNGYLLKGYLKWFVFSSIQHHSTTWEY